MFLTINITIFQFINQKIHKKQTYIFSKKFSHTKKKN